MILSIVEITDFLSIKGTVRLDFDRKVTVLLGSNDHGKTNILKAIEHLNDGALITEEEANWDADGPTSISYTFLLTTAEKREWKAIIDDVLRRRTSILQKKAEEESEPNESTETTVQPNKSVGTSGLNLTSSKPSTATEEPDSVLEPELLLSEEVLTSSQSTIVLKRIGVGASMQFGGVNLQDLPGDISTFFEDKTPRVELFKALTGNLQDSATAENITTEEYEFLQGVFFYAGIDPEQSGQLFVQNDKTVRALDKASEELDKNLRRLWGQGTELRFGLRHNGKTSSIEFLADDPAVKSRKARMSKRSDGVTQFFRVSMMLYARRKKNPANSYIYLFDEPGVLLHPQGQRDLLQVFEQLADDNQIVYATHSLFLLNQNFPERHRLIFKDEGGTKIDHKPYRQNWKWATDALGVYFTSNILFSNRVLLVEGDSDPMYLYELFRQLNKSDDFDVDLNSVGIMSFYDYHNLRFLLQMFKRDGQDVSLFVLTDGDHEGKGFLQRVDALCKRLSVPTHQLRDGRSIEDYCIFESEFVKAVTQALTNACEAEGKKVPEGLAERAQKSWDDRKTILEKPEKRRADKDDERVTAGKWYKDLAKELLDDEASKIVLARTYVELCRDQNAMPPKGEKLKEARSLCKEIAAKLRLPSLKAAPTIESAS